jgi:hypothetical protein
VYLSDGRQLRRDEIAAHLAELGGLRTTQRNPMWLVEVSIAAGWRAAGR